MRRGPFTLLTLGALVLALASAPTFALCASMTNDGCCHDGKCPKLSLRKARGCCGADRGAPAPLRDMAPASSSGSMASVDCEPVAFNDDSGRPGWPCDPRQATPPDPAPPPLHTLHTVFLI
jgi:hypothetical protein